MSDHDFDAMLSSLKRQTFTIGGQDFTVRKSLSYKTLNMFISENTLSEFESAEQFFAKAIIPSDRVRFKELLDREGLDDEEDGEVITLPQMTELVKYLMDYYTGKSAPKEPSSSDGQVSTGPPSNVVSLPAGSPV